MSRSVKPDPGWVSAIRTIQALAVHRGVGVKAHTRFGSHLEAMGHRWMARPGPRSSCMVLYHAPGVARIY